MCGLLDLLASALARRGCDSMSLGFLGAHRMVELFESVGFYPRESSCSMMVDAGESWAWETSLLRDGETWFVTDSDEDA